MLKRSKWIKTPVSIGAGCPDFRRSFKLSGRVRRATAVASAIGLYLLYINGERASDAILTPGFTSYRYRVQYQKYDVTELLAGADDVTLSILAATGWAKGRWGWKRKPIPPTDEVAVIAELLIEYEDGRCESIVTDEAWEVYTSKILFSEIYDGETVDLTAIPRRLGAAVIDTSKKPRLVKSVAPPVRERERVAPVRLFTTPRGERVIDFGQNLAGYVEFRVKGRAGERITVSHAEVLDSDGNFYTGNLRSAKNVNNYLLDGKENILKPSFSFQGFRYARLDEYPDCEVDLSAISAVAIYSDIRRTGGFACGNDKLNRLYSNIIWGQRSNFIDIPTDCPQRDERLGWTGDAQVFSRTAAINYDVKSFFEKWLADLALAQGTDGGLPEICPTWLDETRGFGYHSSAAWSDAGVICPWEMYRAYGDKRLLKKHYPMMKKWIEYMHSYGEDEYLYVGGKHYGDWLALDVPFGKYKGATQTDLIASAYFAYSTSLVIKAGRALGEDVSYFEELYARVREAFRAAFMKDGLPVLYPKGDALERADLVKPITQTAIALILRFGLFEESERCGLVSKLAELIADFDGRMTTGFVGTPCILHALSESGRVDLAYDLLLQERNPSWLFSVNRGATTIWEHWDSIREDGSFWSDDMNSFNHYAYGSVFDWMFGVMVGIGITDGGEGYSRITYSPKPCRRIGFAEAFVDTEHGKICASWRYTEEGAVRYELTLPQGVTAEVDIEGLSPRILGEGSYVFSTSAQFGDSSI